MTGMETHGHVVPDHDHNNDTACFDARCDKFFMDDEVRDGQGRLVRVERHPRPAEPKPGDRTPDTEPSWSPRGMAAVRAPEAGALMDDLVTWLRAQLDDDERLVRDQQDFDAMVESLRNPGAVDAVLVPPLWQTGAPADTDRVRAEVDAKRRIVELHQPEPGQHPDFCGHDMHEMPCPTLRLLALPYADRPGYQEEWRP